MLRGGLFTQEYLLEGIMGSDAWKALDISMVALACIGSARRIRST
jgi:hypothetical protein